jgi:hypothetical protein
MLKKIVLSLVMVSGLTYSFDDQQREVLEAIRKPEQASDAPESQVLADAIGSLVAKGRSLLSSGAEMAKDGAEKAKEIVKNGVDAVKGMSEHEAAQPASSVEDIQKPEIGLNPSVGSTEGIDLPPVPNLTDSTPKDPVRFAAIRNAWASCVDSKSVQFACDMFNPYAHGRAWKEMWQAGVKGALPKLWADHKAVIAGTVVLTTAAATATYYAHKKGWLAKAKTWAVGLKEQYFVSEA